MRTIKFYNHDRQPVLRNRKKLKFFIEKMFLLEKKTLKNIIYVFCSDKYLLSLNKRFLKHNYYTDIITFDLSLQEKNIVAEIYISIDRVKENARDNGVAFKEELHRVIFHGVLHLCGYKDKNDLQRIVMRKMENRYLVKYKKG